VQHDGRVSLELLRGAVIDGNNRGSVMGLGAMAMKTRFEEQAAATANAPATATATAPAALAAGLGAAASVPQAAASEAAAGTERMANAAAASVNDSVKQTAAGVEQTQARVQQGMEKVMKTTEDFLAFGQGNVEALVKSSQIWAAGLQDLGKQVAATAQAQIEDTVSAFRAMAGAKTVKDAFEVQTTLARTAIEKTLADSGRLTETSIKLTEQALAPVTARVSLAVEKFGRAAA
jgi:phasin family protein